eukprot:130643_1
MESSFSVFVSKKSDTIKAWKVLTTMLIGLTSCYDASDIGLIGYFDGDCPDGWEEYDNLSGRVAVGSGYYIGVTEDGRTESATYLDGDNGGVINYKLILEEIPQLQFSVTAPRYSGESGWAGDGFVSGNPRNWHNNIGTATFSTNTLGGDQPHSNMQPYLVLTPCKKTDLDNYASQTDVEDIDGEIIALKARIELLEKLITSDSSNSGSNTNSSNGSGLISICFAFMAGVANYLFIAMIITSQITFGSHLYPFS